MNQGKIDFEICLFSRFILKSVFIFVTNEFRLLNVFEA